MSLNLDQDLLNQDPATFARGFVERTYPLSISLIGEAMKTMQFPRDLTMFAHQAYVATFASESQEFEDEFNVVITAATEAEALRWAKSSFLQHFQDTNQIEKMQKLATCEIMDMRPFQPEIPLGFVQTAEDVRFLVAYSVFYRDGKQLNLIGRNLGDIATLALRKRFDYHMSLKDDAAAHAAIMDNPAVMLMKILDRLPIGYTLSNFRREEGSNGYKIMGSN